MVAIRHMPADVRDALLARAGEMPAFPPTPPVAGPPLAERRIALITTARLHLRGEPLFAPSRGDYRVIPGDVDPGQLLMSQTSITYDRSGFQEDVNVVFPLSRLREMQVAGEIGTTAARHFSFVGSATEPDAIRPYAAEVAAALLADGVNGVAITPVCPSCTRAAAVLGHFLEAAGIPTAGISLVPEHTAVIGPPRALHVPFELGRPLGVPGDAAFQRRVLRRLLDMLRRMDAPILETYEEVPPFLAEGAMEGWACPVPLPPPPTGGDALADAVRLEQRLLAPWWDEARRRRARTTLGLSPLSPAAVTELLLAFRADPAGTVSPIAAPLADALRYGIDDLRAWYMEAALARPAAVPGLRMADWLYGETALGRLLLALHPLCLAHPEPAVQSFGRVRLVPTHQQNRLSAAGVTPQTSPER